MSHHQRHLFTTRRRLIIFLLGCLQVQTCLAAEADSTAPADANLSPYLPSKNLRHITLFLRKTDGKWTASKADYIKDPQVERITFNPHYNWSVELQADGTHDSRCYPNQSKRESAAYSVCNSNFYHANIAGTAAIAVIKGIFTLGTSLITDTVGGKNIYTVSFDKPEFDRAIIESGALKLAQEQAPLLDYRESYHAALQSPAALHEFIDRYDRKFDPESLVSKARDQISALAIAEAKRAELNEQIRQQRQEQEATRQKHRASIKVADRIKVNLADGEYYALVIAVNQPLIQVQWERREPRIEWIRTDWVSVPSF